jgi:hypothetical protein
MNEWWPFIGLFLALYLLDGFRLSRRSRWYLGAWAGRRGTLAQSSRCSFSWPSPFGWTFEVEDLPASLSAVGLTNWPTGSASRPPPLPDLIHSWRWEEIISVQARRGMIVVNGTIAFPVTAALDAMQLEKLVARMRSASATEREAVLRGWHSRRFRPQALRRRQQMALHRTRGLAVVNSTQTVLLVAAAVYLMSGMAEEVSTPVQTILAEALPWLVGVYVALHGVAVRMAARVHRRLYPESKAERSSLIVTSLLVPAQALRLRLLLLRHLARDQHPLAVALAILPPTLALEPVRATVADLKWPRRPQGLPTEVETIADGSRACLEPIVLAAVEASVCRMQVCESLATPKPDTATSCAWCPRCGDQFSRAEGRCPHGVPLEPLQRNDAAGPGAGNQHHRSRR